MRYGQQHYDFDHGVMTFIAPGQVLTVSQDSPTKVDGYLLVVHPDFFAGYPLATKIRDYGGFSYAANEALHLSESEEDLVIGIFKNISQELSSSIDHFSQELIVSHIGLFLGYGNRFYNRLFITRKIVNDGLLIKFEKELYDYYNSDKLQTSGMSTVQYIAERLHLSPNYLSDMLRSVTGRSTRQHIQDKLIDKAK
jgi:AraC-like DNA-binding protein